MKTAQKKLIQCVLLSFAIFIFTVPVISQELQHSTSAVNVEIPVRVFKGSTFLDRLTIEDFELYENGVLQKIEAVYLIKGKNIQREESDLPKKEALKRFSPQLARHYTLVFEVVDFLPRLENAIDYFFNKVIMEGDSLTVITPMKTYNIKEDALKRIPQQEIARQLKSKLRSDIITASGEYKTLIKNIEQALTLKGIFRWDTGDWKLVIRDWLDHLESLRLVSEKKLVVFSDFLKDKPGQKNVFMFFQKEVLPKYTPFQENLFESMGNVENPVAFFNSMEITSFYHRDVTFDVDKIKRIFSDSSVHIHFLYLTETPIQSLDIERMEPLSRDNVHYVEHSEDIFSAFHEVASATGGYSASSYNAESVFQEAVDASENYYLLYYSPKDYRTDGAFKNISVKVKGQNYKILHRSGYLAD